MNAPALDAGDEPDVVTVVAVDSHDLVDPVRGELLGKLQPGPLRAVVAVHERRVVEHVGDVGSPPDGPDVVAGERVYVGGNLRVVLVCGRIRYVVGPL